MPRLNTLKDAVTKLGSRALDGRSSLSYASKKWRREFIADLGGPDNISTQQSALVDLTVKSKLLLDAIDAWLLIWICRYLSQLGVERRIKTKTLNDILNEDTEPEGHHGKGAEPRQ